MVRALQGWKQEDHELEVSLDYTGLCHKKQNNNQKYQKQTPPPREALIPLLPNPLQNNPVLQLGVELNKGVFMPSVGQVLWVEHP